VFRAQPVYPQEAKDARVEGVVRLAVVIDANGAVTSVSVDYGPEALQQAAIDAVNQWRFQPAKKDGEPISATAKIDINFRLL
jgi:protein TonB